MKACLIIACLLALAVLGWMVLLPSVVAHELRVATGFIVEVKVLRVDPFTGTVLAKGLVIMNPPAYPKHDFIELRGMEAQVELYTWLFKHEIVIDRLDVDAAKIEIVRQHDGRSNLKDFMAALSGPAPEPGAHPPPPAKPTPYLIKKLHVRLDQLVVADYTGLQSYDKSYKLGIDHTYQNVSDPKQLLVPDVIRSLYSFGLRHDTAQLLPGEFGRALADTLGGAAHVGAKATEKTGQFLKGLLDKLEQSGKP